MTGLVCTSMSSWPAAASLPQPPYSSLCLSACWTEETGSQLSTLSHPRCLSQGGRLLSWLLAASTAACPQRATKTKPLLTEQRISPASEPALGFLSQLACCSGFSKVCSSVGLHQICSEPFSCVHSQRDCTVQPQMLMIPDQMHTMAQFTTH